MDTAYQKLALIFACNYYGSNRLRGCINDANNIKSFLVDERGFDASNVTTVYDRQMTTTNMWKQLARLTDKCEQIIASGKTPAVFLYFSGHGITLPPQASPNPRDDKKGDQALIPYDFEGGRFVLDDDLNRKFIDKLPSQVELFIFTDCCNSGTNFDLAFNDGKPVTGADHAEAKIIHLSGCRDDQTSAEVRGYGVATNRFLEVMRAGKSNRVDRFRQSMRELTIPGHTQNPQVSTSCLSLYDGKLFKWLITADATEQLTDRELKRLAKQRQRVALFNTIKSWLSV